MRMVAIIAKAVRTVVRSRPNGRRNQRSMQVTAQGPSERWPAGSASRTTAAMLRLRARTLRAAPVPMAAMPLQMRFRAPARASGPAPRATTRSPAEQGAARPRPPGDIPRPHPMARPTADNGRGGPSGPSRPRPGAGPRLPVAVVRAKVVRAVPTSRPGSGGHNRPGQGGGSQGAGQGGARGGFRGGQGGGNDFQGGRGGHRATVPARGGGRGGRGGAAGAFGRQGGKSSKARQNRLAKRHEYEELKTPPPIGRVRVPNGNGQPIRLRQGASLAGLAERIDVNQAALVTVLFHLGQMATATQSSDEETFQILGEGIGWNIQLVSAEEEDKELLQQFDVDLERGRTPGWRGSSSLARRSLPSWATSTTVEYPTAGYHPQDQRHRT